MYGIDMDCQEVTKHTFGKLVRKFKFDDKGPYDKFIVEFVDGSKVVFVHELDSVEYESV